MFRKFIKYLRTKSFYNKHKQYFQNTPLLLSSVLCAGYVYALNEDRNHLYPAEYIKSSEERLFELNNEGEHVLNRFIYFLTGCVIETSKRYRGLLKQQLKLIALGDQLSPEELEVVDDIKSRLELLKQALDKYDKIVKNVGFMAYNQAISSYLSGKNQAEEIANTVIPPPYSSAVSLEGVSVNGSNDETLTRSNSTIPRSVSVATNNTIQLPQQSASSSFQNNFSQSNLQVTKEVSITNNPCYMQHCDALPGLPNISGMPVTACSTSSNVSDCEDSSSNTAHKLESNFNLEVEHKNWEYSKKLSDLLHISTGLPSKVGHSSVVLTTSTPQELNHYSVINSTTSSDVSSLANFSSLDSPPRATSPTAELRELLEKIQQLPHRKSPEEPQPRGRSCFARSKAKTLYMPLNEYTPNKLTLFGRGSKSWLSRSAPNTPSGNCIPNFGVAKKSDGHNGSKGKICDGSPLLNANADSDEDLPGQNCL